jgi:hypothetical protein
LAYFVFILAIPAHEFGAYAVAYSAPSQMLFSGGKNGDIGTYTFDNHP